jgi:phosphohistidine phosphatase SixA
MRWTLVGVVGCATAAILLSAASAAADEAIWSLLGGGGHVVLLRHAATVEGLGDPPGFRLDDCAAQRNLSDAGRAEARRIGEAFRRRGVPVDRVLSSRWCRCLETARLAFGRVEPWPPLDSFFADRSREADQTRAVRALLAEPRPSGNLVLVTHQVNITALTGIVPAMGELVVGTTQAGGDFRAAGRLGPGAFAGN